jgi:hypothetical protein
MHLQINIVNFKGPAAQEMTDPQGVMLGLAFAAPESGPDCGPHFRTANRFEKQVASKPAFHRLQGRSLSHAYCICAIPETTNG